MAEKQNYNTNARKYILKYLEANHDTTVTAADISDYLSKNGLNVNITTVYRYLNKLTAEQCVVKFPSKNGSGSIYQLKQSDKACHEHIHVKCIKCGRLIHLDCGFMTEIENHLSKDHNFTLSCDGSILYGICNLCKD